MSIINTELTPFVLQKDGTIIIHEQASQEDWLEIHSKLIHAKRYAAGWLKKSREFATGRWGIEFVADAEVQMELALGIETSEKPATLNAGDKSKAIVTIEGIHQSFVLWERKMHDEVESWDKDKLTRALDLLEPMERQAKRVRELLGGGN